VHALAQRLVKGGYLHVATDWAPYAEDVLAALAGEPLLVNRAPAYAERPPWRPQTKFERRGVALGHPVFDLLFERR
jgi:tRNA (guanine-N7-)-methyltransferase